MGSASTFDYASLKELLKSSKAEVLLPEDGEKYEKSIVRWSEHCIKRAAAVVLVTSADDVSATLNLIRKHDIPFVVRGGGHSTSGSASIEDGIVIDLSKMRNVTVDPEAKTVTAEGGCLWEDVDNEAAKHGLAAVGGTVNHTGVGGLTLGGGYGYLSGKHGLAIDNLLSATIVLASGSQQVCSPTSNPTLFWALRGAGASFGIVTSFTFRAHAQPHPVFAGALVFPPSALPQIVTFANKFHATNDGNQVLLIAFSAPPPHNVPVVLTQLFHNGTEEEGKAFFADLFALGPLADMTASIPYPQLNALLNHAAGFEGRKQFGGGAFSMPLDADFVGALHAKFTEFVGSHERMNESLVMFECIPYGKIVEVKNGETAFANRGDYYNVATMLKWFDPSLDNEVRAFSRSWLRELSETAAKRSKDEGVGQYGNYAQADVDANDIFGENVKKLEDIKHKYDPDNLFRRSTKLTPRPLVVVN